MEDMKSPLACKPDYLVCTCMGVMASEIRQAIMDGNRNFDSLSELLMVGTGCSSCVDEVCELLKQEGSQAHFKSE